MTHIIDLCTNKRLKRDHPDLSEAEQRKFTAALARLYFRLPGKAEQVDVVLDEDNKTVTLCGYTVNDEYAVSSFELENEVADSDLDQIRLVFC